MLATYLKAGLSSGLTATLSCSYNSTTRKLAESAARPIQYTSSGLIADTVLSLAFDST